MLSIILSLAMGVLKEMLDLYGGTNRAGRIGRLDLPDLAETACHPSLRPHISADLQAPTVTATLTYCMNGKLVASYLRPIF